jgi:alpha-tubulin suppressor-like RCC1 family protein
MKPSGLLVLTSALLGLAGCSRDRSLGGSSGASASGASEGDAKTFAEVAVGDRHACGRTPAGEVFCWGRNEAQQLGGATKDAEAKSPVRVGALAQVVALAASRDRTCAVVSAGKVWCFGTERLEGAAPRAIEWRVPTYVDTPPAVAVSLERTYALVLLRDGRLHGWGDFERVLGKPVPADAAPPRPVPDVENAARLATGPNAACVVKRDGVAHCWGMPPGDVADATDVGVGNGFACALKKDHSVWCWGENGYGQLGQGNTEPSPAPVRVNAADVAAISVGDWTACAIDGRGILSCWGHQMKDSPATWTRPQRLPVSDVRAVALDKRICAGTKKSGGIYCWGPGVDSPAAIAW